MIDSDHYRFVADSMLRGRVVPLLGAGACECDRPVGARWAPGRHEFLPLGAELAGYLADTFYYRDHDHRDLVRVSQYAALKAGLGPLYERLHEVFDANYPPSPLHQLLARLPATMRRMSAAPRFPVILTTNYDDILERAFLAEGEPFDVVFYLAESDHRGKFVHQPWGEEERVLIESPNEYDGFSLDERPAILKVHGTVDRSDPSRDSYVITEEHYLDYLAHTDTDIAGFLPGPLAVALQRSHFLFLGYALRDWNLRVILHRIWGRQSLRYTSWSVQRSARELDRCFWDQRRVEVLQEDVGQYVSKLDAALEDRAARRPS